MIHINILKTASRVTEDPYFGDFAALFLINSSCEVLIISVILSDQSLEITMNKRLLLVSNSTLHGGGYLQHCQQQIQVFFGKGVKRILFVPYALHDRDAYTKTARDKFKTLGLFLSSFCHVCYECNVFPHLCCALLNFLPGYEVDSVHETPDPVEAVRKAEGIFIGGGNTFRLLKALYDNKLVTEIRKRVLDDGIPYMGSSAGTNVSTISINTTNDMPIVYPPTFAAIGLVPFNINPHYLDADPNSKHMGETREQRIIQFHEEPDTPCVLALREGCMLIVEGNKATLLGCTKARLFQKGKQTTEYEPGSDLSFLLTDAQNI
ncbi:alpha-aspartyl dipeptidase-like isoform X1 [Xyrauchen texanus]|uniref:alpha-aspartyl dipeptidase-like isoform X1 n=1 Tax=Xyrauchen texanus TaxID=154827 RepID=UPI002241E955|nr:alpha-aspartyl dipeptidase-like isoform X1 [Xyrauchen texanus]